jgi:hypothetical protein
MDTVEALQSDILGDFPHGFLGRRGGFLVGFLQGLTAVWVRMMTERMCLKTGGAQ